MSLLRAVTTISGVTLASRILGLIRDIGMTHLLGVTWVMGTFNLAWMIPNMLRRLLGEGALSAAFVPVFSRTVEQGDKVAGRTLLAQVSGGLLALMAVLTTVVLVASLLLPPEVWGLEGEAGVTATERGELMWILVAMLFPYALPICLLAIYAGALNALGSFAIPAAAPLLLNLVWLSALGCALCFHIDDPVAITQVVGGALLFGGLLQLCLGAIPLWRRGYLPRPRLSSDSELTHQVYRAMLPAALGLSLVQLNMVLDQLLTEYLVSPGSNQHLYLANRLLLFPHALVTVPLATAVFPQLARLASSGDHVAIRQHLGTAIRATLFLAIPASAGLIVLADDVIHVLFVHGRYTTDDAVWTTATTISLVAGLPLIGVSQLFARTLYALGDTGTPARIAAWLVLANLALNLVFVLAVGMGVAGFTTATTCCAGLNAWALRRALGSRVPAGPTPWASLGRIVTATGAMVGVVYVVNGLWVADSRTERALLHIAVPVAAGILTYVASHLVLRSPELTKLRDRLRR